jgi:exonuclease VII large subunit
MEASPKHLIVRHRSSLDHWSDRLSRTFQNRQLLRQRDLDGLAARLNATGHKTILKRGFSITRHHRSGRIVTDPSQVREGDRLTTETSGGTFDSRVTNAHQLDLFE